MKNLFLFCIIILTLGSCIKETIDIQDDWTIEELWRIEIDTTIYTNSGIYKDEYIVWTFNKHEDTAQNQSNFRGIAAYSLITGEKVWKYDCHYCFAASREMMIKDNYLISYRDDGGQLIFNLDTKELIRNTMEYSSHPYYFSKTIYNSISRAIVAFDILTKDENIVFEWEQDENQSIELSTPVIIIDQNSQKKNLFSVLHIGGDKLTSGPDIGEKIYFISVNEDWTINWKTPLELISGEDFTYFLPVVYEENIIVTLSRKIYSFNSYTGAINWEIPIDGHSHSKIVIRNNEYYVIVSLGNFMKFDPENGDVIWSRIPSLVSPSYKLEFETFDNYIVYRNNYSENLKVIDKNTGEYLWKQSASLSNSSTPKFYKSDNCLVVHTQNEIVGFKINN